MFSEDELKIYGEMFNKLNINQKDQLTILEFFYGLGTLIYVNNNN